MAATIVLDGTKIANGDDVGVEVWDATRWRGSGGAPSGDQSDDVFLEGTNAVLTRSTNSRVWLWFDIGAGNELDFGVAGSEEGQHVSIWFNMIASGLLQLSTYVSGSERGGLGIAIGSSTTNYDYWNMGGKDNYAGGWRNLTVDPTKTPTGDGGTGLDIASARYFGVWVDTSATAKFDNFVVDSIVVGNGLIVYATSTTDDLFGDIIAADEGTIANKYGFVRSDNGIMYVKGGLTLGDDVGTNGAGLTSANRTVVFEMQEYKNSGGTWVTSVSSTFHALTRVGNATNGTALTIGDGTAIQAGESNLTGLIPIVSIDLDDEHSGAGADLIIDGARFSGISGLLSLSEDGNYTCDSTIFNDCIEVTGAGDGSDGIVIRDSIFQNYSGESAALQWGDGASGVGMDVESCLFQNNNGGTASHAIRHTDGTTEAYINLLFLNNDYDVYLNHATANLTINKEGTSDPTTYTSSGTGSVTFVGTKTLTITVKDTAGAAIADAQVYLHKSEATKTNFTSGVGNAQGDTDFVVTEVVDTDYPQEVWITVNALSDSGSVQTYRSATWVTKTFTFPTSVTGTADAGGSTTVLKRKTGTSFLTADIEEGDTVRNTTDGSWGIVDEIVDADTINLVKSLSSGSWDENDGYSFHTLALGYTSATDLADIPLFMEQTNGSGQVVWSYNYASPIDIVIRVRKTGYIVDPKSDNISGDYSTLITMQDDNVYE